MLRAEALVSQLWTANLSAWLGWLVRHSSPPRAQKKGDRPAKRERVTHCDSNRLTSPSPPLLGQLMNRSNSVLSLLQELAPRQVIFATVTPSFLRAISNLFTRSFTSK